MGMSIDKAIERYKNNAEYERTHGNLQGCLEFRQLAKWLEKYQKIEKIVKAWNNMNYFDSTKQISQGIQEIMKVVEDGKID